MKENTFHKRLDKIQPNSPLYEFQSDFLFLRGQYYYRASSLWRIESHYTLLSAINDTIQHPFDLRTLTMDSLNLSFSEKEALQQNLQSAESWATAAFMNLGVMSIGMGMGLVGFMWEIHSLITGEESSPTAQKMITIGTPMMAVGGTLFCITIPITTYKTKKAQNFIGLSNRNNFHDYLKEQQRE